ncbi:MAG: hypothetical protein ACRC2K_13395 [Clostridium sp.]
MNRYIWNVACDFALENEEFYIESISRKESFLCKRDELMIEACCMHNGLEDYVVGWTLSEEGEKGKLVVQVK